jgi:hypothetical protein
VTSPQSRGCMDSGSEVLLTSNHHSQLTANMLTLIMLNQNPARTNFASSLPEKRRNLFQVLLTWVLIAGPAACMNPCLAAAQQQGSASVAIRQASVTSWMDTRNTFYWHGQKAMEDSSCHSPKRLDMVATAEAPVGLSFAVWGTSSASAEDRVTTRDCY